MTPRPRACSSHPRGITSGVDGVQELVLAAGIHRLPKAIVLVETHLAVSHQTIHRLLLKHQVFAVIEIAEYLSATYEKATRYAPRRSLRLFVEFGNETIRIRPQLTEAPRGTHRGNGKYSAVRLVEFQ